MDTTYEVQQQTALPVPRAKAKSGKRHLTEQEYSRIFETPNAKMMMATPKDDRSRDPDFNPENALNRVPDATGDNNRGNARKSIAPKVFFLLCLQSPYQMNYSADALTTTSASAKGSATRKFVAAASLPEFARIPAAATSPSVRTSSPWRLKAMANTR